MQSRADAMCDLVVVTEREKFVVPIIALGAAAALDLPDQLNFNQARTPLSVSAATARFSCSRRSCAMGDQ